MVFASSLPIPGFVEAIPLPSQTMSSAEQGTSSRKLKENLNGIHNPIRRTFTVPVAPEEVNVHDAIRNTLLYMQLKITREVSESKGDAQSEPKNKKSALDIAIEKEKDRLEKHFKALKSHNIQAKAQLKRNQTAETQAKHDLIRAIKDRDQEMKTAKHSPRQPAKDNEEIVGLNKEKDELEAEVKEMEKVLKALEDSWHTEKQQHLEKQMEERKRKAEEQIEEQQRKKQRTDKDSEISEIQRLEQELKVRLIYLFIVPNHVKLWCSY